jgi:hypothetical protein
MSVVQTNFFRGVVPVGPTLTTIYDTTGNIVVTNVIITNATASSKTVTLQFPSSDGTGIPVLSSTLINANDTVSFDMKQVVAIVNGTKVIKASASVVDSVYIHLSGVVITQ